VNAGDTTTLGFEPATEYDVITRLSEPADAQTWFSIELHWGINGYTGTNRSTPRQL